MNARPGRRPGSSRTGASTEPRREVTRTISPCSTPEPRRRPRATGRASRRDAAASGSRFDCTPVLYESSRRPVVSRIGNSSSSSSIGGAHSAGPRTAPRGPCKRLLPQPPVQERRARDGPRSGTATGCRRAPPAARSSCRGASGTASAARPTPARASAGPSRGPGGGELADDPVSSRAPPGGSSALRTRCTRRSLFVTVPSASHHERRRRQHDVGQLAVLVRKMS